MKVILVSNWRSVLACWLCVLTGLASGTEPQETRSTFKPTKDLLSLHYDHAPDKDDGHSAAADRALLESLFGAQWIRAHVVPVSGAYGKNRAQFDPESDSVMNVAWNDCGGWLAAHTDHDRVLAELSARWQKTLATGGDVWVKEGGQSDITAEVVKKIKAQRPEVNTDQRIHVVQHSDWNESETTDDALAYTKQHTQYVRISDANAYLNIPGGDAAFEKAAVNHPVFGAGWLAAFEYYDPKERLDFSDTGELMHILGLGEMSVDEFRTRFLETAQE